MDSLDWVLVSLGSACLPYIISESKVCFLKPSLLIWVFVKKLNFQYRLILEATAYNPA